MVLYRISETFYQQVTYIRLVEFEHVPTQDEIRDAFIEGLGEHECGPLEGDSLDRDPEYAIEQALPDK